MKIHYFQHVSFEGPGYIQKWLKAAGHEISYTQFFKGDHKLPSITEIDALIIMGGPMGVYDDSKYPWLRDEKVFIKQCIDQGKKVLGICLGAQLIAASLGAEVHRAPQKEIGWSRIKLTDEGNELRWFRELFKDKPNVFHWHGDQFEIPGHQNASLLSSQANINQAFCYQENVIGLQFHLEVNDESLEQMLLYGAADLIHAPFVQSISQIKEGSRLYMSHCNAMMSQILSHWLSFQYSVL